MSDKFVQFDEIVSALGVAGLPDVWRKQWELICASPMPSIDEWLSDDLIGGICDELDMSEPMSRACLDSAVWIRSNSAAYRFAWLVRQMLGRSELCQHLNKPWPMLNCDGGQAAEMFYAVAFIAAMPKLREYYRQVGVPDDIALATLSDLPRWIELHRQKHSRWGFSEMHWLVWHFAGELYQLGRLQFQRTTLSREFTVYRRGRELVALPEAGLKFRRDGQFDGSNGICDEQAWEVILLEDDNKVEGNAILSGGAAKPKPVTLSNAEWQVLLKPGDPVLFIHIPSGIGLGPMTTQACEESFAQASEFFARYYPGHGAKMCMTETWLLDRQLADYLPSDSNIINFQKLFHLYPIPIASDEMFQSRVMGGKVTDWSKAPQKNTLQRAIVKHVLLGGHWRVTGGFRPLPAVTS